MLKIITAAMALAALAPAPGHKEIVKLPLAGDGSVIVKIMPHKARTADADYSVEGEEKDGTARYEELKRALDERFARMFELKDEIDGHRSAISEMCEEYGALRDKYNRELRKIISAWVTESDYTVENIPVPYK